MIDNIPWNKVSTGIKFSCIRISKIIKYIPPIIRKIAKIIAKVFKDVLGNIIITIPKMVNKIDIKIE